MVWGGSYLQTWLTGSAAPQPIGEAWILSDEGTACSTVADGPLKGRTLRDLIQADCRAVLGSAAVAAKFPLLLKFLDARDNLSVQVHPDDMQAARLRPGNFGKTEAWVIIGVQPGGRIYAGLKPGVDAPIFQQALKHGGVAELLHAFEPRIGDFVFLPAGTVHAIGGGIRLFEIQQSSDVTFRLFDWNRVDPQTGMARTLHVDEGLACIDFARGPVTPRHLSGPISEQLADNAHFRLWRHVSVPKFDVGAPGECRVLVGIAGTAQLHHRSGTFEILPGSAWLLPADAGACRCDDALDATILECGLAKTA